MMICQIKNLARIISLACLLSACGGGPPQPEMREWTEDVLLSPGRTIQVKRTVAFDESNSLSGDAYNAVEREATIAFTGELAYLPVWRQPLMALVLYQDSSNEEWVIVATSTSCEVWRARGKPEPLYWEFRLVSGSWMETALSPESVGKPANLLHRYRRESDDPYITVEDRRRLEAGSQMNRRFRSVVKDEKVSCYP